MAILYGTPIPTSGTGGTTIVEGKELGYPVPVSGSYGPLSPVEVLVQDPHTDTVILPAMQLLGSTTLAVEAVPESYAIEVASSASMTIGDHIRIIDQAGERYYAGYILGISGTTIDLDSPIDFDYKSGSEVTNGNTNMAVDGSVTPVHFHLRSGSPSIPQSIDITRIIMICECNSAVDLNKFGDIIGGLDRGLLMRISNGHLRNVFNIKTNRGLAALAYDWTPYDASHPNQGINGFAMRLTFGGQSKIGVVLRVRGDGQLGFIVQDDLSSLVTLGVAFEGHITDEPIDQYVEYLRDPDGNYVLDPDGNKIIAGVK